VPERGSNRLLALAVCAIIVLIVMARPDVARSAPCSGPTISTSCSGPYSWTGGDLVVDGRASLSGTPDGVTVGSGITVGSLIDNGAITGTGDNGAGIGNAGTITMLSNGGTITSTGSNGAGIDNTGTITSLANGSIISGTGSNSNGIDNESTIGTLINSGFITGTNVQDSSGYGAGIDNAGTITTLINNGTIVGGSTGSSGPVDAAVQNSNLIVTLTNSGTIAGSGSGSGYGIDNLGTITTLTNSDGGSIFGGLSSDSIGVANHGTITTLINRGAIAGTGDTGSGTLGAGIANWNAIGTLINGGTISGGASGRGAGIYNGGTVTSLTNTGTISGGHGAGLFNGGTVMSLTNSGTISGTVSSSSIPGDLGAGINNYGGIIGTLTNSGILEGSQYAIHNTGTLGLIIDSGVLAGDIVSASQSLTIAGGLNGAVGTLRGYNSASAGTITVPGMVFTAGALLLDDNIVTTSGSGTVTSNASLRLNQTINVTGNYIQGGGGGALVIGVSSATSYGKLAVSGSADLSDGLVSVVPTNGSTLTAGTYTVVSAGTLSASGVTAVSTLPASANVSGNDLLVTLSSWSQPTTQAGGRATSLGPVLDRLSSDGTFTSLLTQLSGLPPSQQAHAFQQMETMPLVSQVVVSGAMVAPTTSAINQRLAVLQEGDQRGAAAGDEYRRSALWGQTLGSRTSQDRTAGSGGYSASTVGLLFGADTQVTDDTITGLAVSWLRGDSKGKGDSAGSTAQVDSYQLSLYGNWRPVGAPAHVEGLLGVANNQYNQKRTIDFLNRVASAQYQGWQYQAKLGAGYDIPLGGVTATPLGSLQVVRVENDAYTERNAGAADLAVDRQGVNSLESELGERLSASVPSDGGLIDGDFQATWVHSFTNSPIAVSAAMGGQSFTNTSARLAADGARLAVGTTLHRLDGLSLRLEYDGEIRVNYRSNTGLFKIRSEF
jgi:outer membrane autotransporter protein